MLFRIFDSQEERRNFGGSKFIEIQFCKMPYGTKTKKLVSVNSINHWQNDSLYLYIDDVDAFYEEYGKIFNCGIYNNLRSGIVDIFGINYYAFSLVDPIVEKVKTDKPADYEILVDWLIKSKEYNGFYILGI